MAGLDVFRLLLTSLDGCIQKTSSCPFLTGLSRNIRIARQVRHWKRSGRPLPPPHVVKQQVLKAYARRYALRVLVETGTHHGEMVDALRSCFARVYSIELSHELYWHAKRRFAAYPHIEIFQGDSGTELAGIVNALREPALFWLDGHYSGAGTAKGPEETPIDAELHHILASPERRHVIIIDDARLLGSDPAYPSLGDLTMSIARLAPDRQITVSDDIVRVTPASSRRSATGFLRGHLPFRWT